HLGVTEAGSGEEARMKSITGIGSLLASGIGDTVRVSLTEEPVNEIPVAKELVKYYGRNKNAVSETIRNATIYKIEPQESLKILTGQRFPVVVSGISQKAELRFDPGQEVLITDTNRKIEIHQVKEFQAPENSIIKLSYPAIPSGELMMRAAVDFTLLAGYNTSTGIWIENGQAGNPDELASLSLKVLQALGKRFTQAVFIACPSCGRSQFNVIEKLKEVKAVTSHLKGLKIAVMGCIVNGIGEMGDADYGFVGAGPGKVTLYQAGKPVLKNVDESNAVTALINLIKMETDRTKPGN
ncbi:MAG: flavodoxin-dependent (E)-4-hydroxy-3-methylbut-2-enyl-diphosphate synthase, partial [Chlorobi bacterium]|nr:flavodoxin-dependent (E)-4-hydroxy-3-methylbut-2-enyl-diphosphate synthase [Chlorobiota bacterium]